MQALAPTRCNFSTGARLQHAPRRQHVVHSTRTVAYRATTKASDFRQLTDAEIDQQVQDAKVSLFMEFRIPQRREQKKPKPQLKWNLEIKIAQLLTVKREREIAEGINMRKSRSKKRAANVLAGHGKIRI